MTYKKYLICLGLALATVTSGISTLASDHDDGEADLKGRDLNLTDFYVFREDKEVSGGSNANLVFIMNSNPRSLPQQQYFFSTQARYDIHISRAGTSTAAAATTADNVILRVTFGAPNTANQQVITLTTIVDGAVTGSTSTSDAGSSMLTTPLSAGATPVNSTVTIGGQAIQVFAGLRKDPFFFDVNAFFKFRAAAAGTGGKLPVPGFAAFPVYTPNGAVASDFTAGYNVNTIALKVPTAFLQKSSETVFDMWTTISVPQ